MRVTRISGCSATRPTGREIGEGVVARALVQRLIGGESAGTADHGFVSVRIAACHAARSVHSAGAADVLDHELLSEDFGEMGRDDASENVIAASRGEGDDKRDGTGGPVLREAIGGAKDADQCSQSEQFSEIHDFHPCENEDYVRFCPPIVLPA